MHAKKLKMLGRAGSAGLALWFGASASAAVIEPELEKELARRAPSEELSVIVTLTDKVDTRAFKAKDRRHRDNKHVKALKDKAAVTQAGHKNFLKSRGARDLHELWVINGIAVTARADVIKELATRFGIERIRPNSILQAPAVTYGSAAPPEWNLAAVHAQDLWALGYTGGGVVVANMDTGVDPDHPDLAGKWRGGGNSWYDPHGEHAVPYDPIGHGTQTMGIMVGGAAGGTAIGVAPDAHWIATKLYNDAGQATYSDIHLAFQWLLDPDGDLATVDAPDVVNASWGLVGNAGQCLTEFSADIDALKAGGVAVVFAGGNDGPAPLTSLSPANNTGGFATGAVDASLTVADFSSRGPSACDGSIYPEMSAPGVNVNTADLSFGGLPLYAVVSGASYAAPHTAGVMALLANAFPQATVGELEAALTQSAQDLGVAGPDNSYGYGLANAQAAYQILLAAAGSPPVIFSTPVTTATQGMPYSYAVQASDPGGSAITYALDVAPAGMTIDAASGMISWTPAYSQSGAMAVTVRATNARGLAVTQSFSVNVTVVNVAPSAANDAYNLVQGGTLTVTAAGVLGNDSDPNLDPLTAVLVNGTANGSLTLNANGSFSYTPNAGFAGMDGFVYQASDGALLSNSASVAITVNANRPPLANNDSATAAYRSKISYTPKVINVLANDSDPDGNLNPASVAIVTAPNKGGKVTVNANGTVSYTPKQYFRGTETFRYTVRDALGAVSNAATVSVSVR
ncbi:MAG: S8 family serine peptidase [Pseudomonadota bacterium]